MDKSADKRIVGTQKIAFPNGNSALLVAPSVDVLTSEIIDALNISQPQAVMLIAGGAAEMSDDVALVSLFTWCIADLAATYGALIIDGGTHTGVMALTGQGVAARQHQSTLLGIAPAHKVVYPGKTPSSALTPLDPNHSHFVLVDSDQWGDETATMYELARHYTQQNPSVAVLADGGPIAKKEILYNVRQQRPIIVIEGSGRLADEIARLWKEQPTSFPDPEFAEIITQGNIHLFSLRSPHSEFAQLLQSQLNR